MGIPVNKVAHLKSVSTARFPDAPVGEDGDTSFGELVGDEDQRHPVEDLQENPEIKIFRLY